MFQTSNQTCVFLSNQNRSPQIPKLWVKASNCPRPRNSCSWRWVQVAPIRWPRARRSSDSDRCLPQPGWGGLDQLYNGVVLWPWALAQPIPQTVYEWVDWDDHLKSPDWIKKLWSWSHTRAPQDIVKLVCKLHYSNYNFRNDTQWNTIYTGWWYTYPSEKSWTSSGFSEIPNWMESQKIHSCSKPPISIQIYIVICTNVQQTEGDHLGFVPRNRVVGLYPNGQRRVQAPPVRPEARVIPGSPTVMAIY